MQISVLSKWATALTLIVSTTVAHADPIRPADSLVSSAAAAKSADFSVAQNRARADLKDGNHLAPLVWAIIILILLLATTTAAGQDRESP